MPETTSKEVFQPMTFDAIKIGLASPEKIRSWSHRTPEPADKNSEAWKRWFDEGVVIRRLDIKVSSVIDVVLK
jgi:DNA-directed RNA polymerase beta' subunit